MFLKNRLFIKALLILGIYFLMLIPMWHHVPEWRYDVFQWFKYWSSFYTDWDLFINNLDNFSVWVPQHFVYTSVIGVMLIIFIIFYKSDPNRDAYGKASFATSHQIKEMGFSKNSGLVLGVFKNKLLLLEKPLSVLLLAPPGTGKTSGIVIPSVYSCKHSMVIHDPKGEIYDITKNKKIFESKVILFDPSSDNCAKFNPLSENVLPNKDDEIYNYVRNISSILIRQKLNNQDSFFMEEARNCFTFFAMWLIWKHSSTSFPEIRSKILSKPDLESVIYEMCPSLNIKSEKKPAKSDKWKDESSDEMVKEVVDNTPEHIKTLGIGVLGNLKSDKQWAAIISDLRQSLDVFHSQSVIRATSSNCDFSAESIRKEPHTIYLVIKEIDRDRLSPLIAIIFASLSRSLLTTLPKPEDQTVSFILDEFVRLGKIDSIIDMPSVGRGYRFNAMFIAQDYGQITDVYSKDKLSAIESNTAYKIVLSQSNTETAKKIAEQIGYTTRIKESEGESIHTKDAINKGKSKNITKEAALLMSHQDIMNMDNGKGVVLAQNYYRHPIKISLPYYFDHPKFKRY